MAALPNDLRRDVTIEINSPNLQEILWIRGILRQGMVVARQTIATYIEVVVQ